ncbi:DUF6635 family protein [Tropicimonas isoalkanivorans]|uniref:DUF6635 family protein n=1 Tax=Tropicimonas isoalkanivorans TaxID=441112 RepID=UPI000ACFA013|nr:DUF6635 family protein [Tropicimonas isoalkanivorans]
MTEPTTDIPARDDRAFKRHRDTAVRAFVRQTFGPLGTLRLHRAAFGLDLLRAPANVALAPVFLLTRLAALLAKVLGAKRLSAWLMRRDILLETNVSTKVRERMLAFIGELAAREPRLSASPTQIEAAVSDYVGVRNAVAEITTSLVVLAFGLAIFHSATPGVISLAGPVAEMHARTTAIESFPLGQGLGRMYYGLFPQVLPVWQVVLSGVILAAVASVVTTFAGVIADPLQVLSGTHRRRINRLLDRLATNPGAGQGLAREHVAARMGDMTDMALSLWRFLRG